MRVTHILKDGTRTADITGHVITELPEFYRIISQIRERIAHESYRSDSDRDRARNSDRDRRCV